MRRHRVILFVPLVLACKNRETMYDVVDTPSPIPVEVAAPAKVDEHPSTPDAEQVSQCVRGTGKNAEGKCEPLRTRAAEGVQQVQIPAGRFVVGDIPPQYDASETRKEPRVLWSGQPPRHAELPAYWIDLHEVTRAAYAKCVEAGKCTAATCPAGAEDPVAGLSAEVAGTVPQSCVTHEQAAAYCKQRGARLPSEIEFEYAARGTDARVYPWGNELLDEYRAVPMPVNGMVDSSYFGIKGMGSNVIEWVAEPFEADVGIRTYVDGEFRKPGSAFLRAVAELAGMHVVKGGRAGARQPKKDPEPVIGFRCVDDLEAGEPSLVVPSLSAEIPLAAGPDVQFFGGVAESVDRDEAVAFCDRLKVDAGGSMLDDWRLPTFDEVQANAQFFRGPGPFWTSDGAATQHDGSGKRPEPTAAWTREEAEPSEPLAARCARGR